MNINAEKAIKTIMQYHATMDTLDKYEYVKILDREKVECEDMINMLDMDDMDDIKMFSDELNEINAALELITE